MEVEEERDALVWGHLEAEEQPPRPTGGDLRQEDHSLDQTGFLLQRLQDLKRWQKEQEMRLLRDQQRQIEDLQKAARKEEQAESGDDDATIDQDVSSLTSYEELPANNYSYSSTFDDEGDVESSSEMPRLATNVAVPSWASRTESEGSHEPQTVFAVGKKGKGKGNVLDEQPVGNPKSFEQLLAEQLAVSSSGAETTVYKEEKKKPSSPEKKAFLRKGSGLARYRGVGRTLSRSKSQSSVSTTSSGRMRPSTSCFNLDIAERETIAFASKKTPPRKANGSNTNVSAKAKTSPPNMIKTSLKQLKSNVSKVNVCEGQPEVRANPQSVEKPGVASTRTGTGYSPTRGTLEGIENDDDDDDDDASPIHDSVEWSFREKLKKADRTREELKDLAAFEMLEEAACDSSFCSSSSKVKHIIGDMAAMPSPIPKPKNSTSTPVAGGKLPPSDDPSLGQSLIDDIQTFLQKRGAVVTANASDDDGDEDDDTLRDELLKNEIAQVSDDGDSDGWCSVNEEDKRPRNRVRFKDAKDFSPPRMPRNSPSYLIWSIFTKEREERRRKKNKSKPQQQPKSASPLSNVFLHRVDDGDFKSTLLQSKLTELDAEIKRQQEERSVLQTARRKLQESKKKLAEDVAEFERSKEVEKKKFEEERRRIKRDRMMLEKAQKENKLGKDKKAAEEIEDLQAKLAKMHEDLQRKESKWSASLAKLQEQVKYLEKENQHLHEENHRMKLKGVSAKISTGSGVVETPKPQVISLKADERKNSSSTPDSGYFKSSVQENALNHHDMPQDDGRGGGGGGGGEASVNGSVPTPTLSFSPADSLDSNVTLVPPSSRSDPPPSRKKVVSCVRNDDKEMTVRRFDDGSAEITYDNGSRRVVDRDKMATDYYYNGDVRETLPSGLVKYYYKQAQTWHFTYPNRKEVLRFPNGQEEIRYPDGSSQITFPDGSLKRIGADGAEEMSFPDGTRVQVLPSGERTLHLANGEREVHTAEYKRREYPDGTVKTLFNDGRQESRYANGRIRRRDKDGKLVFDSHPERT